MRRSPADTEKAARTVTRRGLLLGTAQLAFAGLLVGLVTCLALEEKIHAKKSVIVGVFAMVTLLLGAAFHLLPIGPVDVDYGDDNSCEPLEWPQTAPAEQMLPLVSG